jgi:carboxyl-terminal processing protease
LECKGSFRHWGSWAVVLVWAACLAVPASASWGEALAALSMPQLRQQAEQLEATGQWANACQVWEAILARVRNLPEARERFQYCQRRASQVRRHLDASFRQQVTTLPFADSLQAYQDVLNKLHVCYVDRDRAEFLLLFKQGLDELRFALSDEAFCQHYLAGQSPELIGSFKLRLQTDWGQTALRRAQDAENEAREVALAAQQNLGLQPTLAVLEFICGACGGLDEYTSYLTPGQLKELAASWKGEAVGVGMDLRLDSLKRLCVAQVAAGSPAHRKGIKTGELVLRIGQRTASELSVETAAALLRGEAGSTVELEMADRESLQPHVVAISRQVLHLASVSEPRFLDEPLGIGYVQLLAFQETTLQELDEAVAHLEADGMRALILDLRGNPGGLFDVAVQVAERFLSVGVIVTTHGQEARYNRSYAAHGANVLDVPLIVLVDGDTASSAEMLAGALKDNQRGTLIGQTTFGKGSIQKVRKLERTSAGIRLTVAKFYSPGNSPFSGVGVSPNLEVERDRQLETALDVARPLAMGR